MLLLNRTPPRRWRIERKHLHGKAVFALPLPIPAVLTPEKAGNVLALCLKAFGRPAF
jgi:hypothetical protein